MPRRAMLAGVGGLLTVAVLTVRGGSASLERRGAEERARRFFLQALDHRARFDAAGMWREFRAARAADPTYLPAVTEALASAAYYLPATLAVEIDSFAAAQADPVLGACIRALLAHRLDFWAPIELPPHASQSARACVAEHRLQGSARRGEERERTDLALSLWRRFPDSPKLAALLAAELVGAGEWQEAAAAAVQMRDGRRPPFVRAQGHFYQGMVLHHLGRHAEAARLEREADADTRRSGGGIRLPYLQNLYDTHAGLLRDAGTDSTVAAHARRVMDAAEAEMGRLAKQADVFAAIVFRLQRAERLLDNGELNASVREWDVLAHFADSIGSPDLQAHVQVRRGRALVKLGHTTEAERNLLAGREFSRRTNHLQWRYESEHNLLHLYEATGQDGEAHQAAEAFVTLTELGGPLPVRLMAHHDLAWFHLRRGERERARQQFEAVLAYTDSVAGYDYWAGEYFELTGDLDRAEAYFRRAVAGKRDTRPYAGLARLAEGTGDLKRAIQYARAHDATAESAHYPEFAPLLPGILARHGRIDEAAVELAQARERAAGQGQAAAWATLSVDLAVLELRRGNAARAAAIADSAGEAGARVGAAEVGFRARGVAGRARVSTGGAETRRGLADMRAVMAHVERTHQAQLEAELLAWYGEALAAVGRTHQALTTLGRAADLTDSIALSLELDPARAGFRAAQIHISSIALAVTADRARDSWARERYMEWSVRRKSRGVLEPDGATDALSLNAMQQALGPDQAVLDYAVLDSTVAALVITDRSAGLRRLPVRADSLRTRVDALLSRLAPRIGTQVDTAHSFFDVSLAERLFADLLAPLETILAGRTRLVIVADGPLHLVPFDALVVAATPQVIYAVDRYEITVAPSLAVLARPRTAPPAGLVVAVAGPGAKGIEPELAALGALAARGLAVLRGNQSSEAQVRQFAGTAALLHFAAHARPNDAEPAFARLSLSPADGDDGRLHAYEIERLRLSGALVVLSACETGAGRLLAGEGVLSLSRAFLRAGASGTVATLWPVGPATGDLMGVFYPALARGDTPAAALRQAKLTLRRRRWANPFHWAGFTLVTRGN